MKPKINWIVLADAETVRIAVNEGPGKGIYGRTSAGLEAPPVTELSDAPGMTNAAVGPNRGGISDPDLKGQAAAIFADRIAQYLDDALRGNEYDRLVLVAAPAMLGLLRQKIPAAVQKAVLAELDKDLTHITLDHLPAHLGDVMVV